MDNSILNVKNLQTVFHTPKGYVKAIRGIDINVSQGEILGIVGESGSGKSVCMKSVMRILPSTAEITADEINYKGENILLKTEDELRKYRGKEMAMIFQDPMTSLNPLKRIGKHLTEVVMRHRNCSKEEAYDIALDMLKKVGITNPEMRMKRYPHEFSGGMRQRVLIAMALCCEPSLLIADEPTTALDVTIQAQILELLKEINEERNMSIILISHDMGVMASTCTKVAVMYGGIIVEEGTTEEIFNSPKHPYTKSLLESIPDINKSRHTRLTTIEGTPPSLSKMPKGCPFADRCKYKLEKCENELPKHIVFSETQKAACFLAGKFEEGVGENGK